MGRSFGRRSEARDSRNRRIGVPVFQGERQSLGGGAPLVWRKGASLPSSDLLRLRAALDPVPRSCGPPADLTDMRFITAREGLGVIYAGEI